MKLVATGCAPNVHEGLGERFQEAARSALGAAGWTVVDTSASHQFTARLVVETDYCSDVGIISGTTSLTLLEDGKAAGTARATGDQANGETIASTMEELVAHVGTP